MVYRTDGCSAHSSRRWGEEEEEEEEEEEGVETTSSQVWEEGVEVVVQVHGCGRLVVGCQG